MPVFTPYSTDVFRRCEELSTISQTAGKINRQYLTPEHYKVNQVVGNWMKQAGMKTWVDEAGNVWGRYESKDVEAQSFVMGSHLDSVPDAGKYDGILGVLAPISLIQYFSEQGISFPFHIDVVGFCDEEGSRFGTTLLGSRAVTGTWKENWAILKDASGKDLASSMRDFGLDINHIHNAQLSRQQIIGFLELHIEQGPVLESKDLSVGYVTAISGAKRFSIAVQGISGHAGTVPMHMRNDALVAVSKMIVAIDQIARGKEVVATVGQINNHPNAVNVISGQCQFSLDLRSQQDDIRETVLNEIRQTLNDIATEHEVTLHFKQTHHADAVECHPVLTDHLRKSLHRCGLTDFGMASGAGHDAMEMANICPVSMLFMRCEKGISHHPDEAVDASDINVALQVLNAFFLNLGDEINNLTQSSKLTGSEASAPQSLHEPS